MEDNDDSNMNFKQEPELRQHVITFGDDIK